MARTSRELLKRSVFLISATVVSPLYLLFRFNALFLDKETAFQGVSQMMSLVPGRPGTFLRQGFYGLCLRRCSPDCAISFGTILSTPDCEIGRHVYIGAYCVISDSVIGDDTLIGSQVHIISGKHAHGSEASDTPMRLQPVSRQVIHIGENCWIGNGAIVMADIGRGCVVGAGSVVTKALEPDSVAVGNPARVIRTRTDRPSY